MTTVNNQTGAADYWSAIRQYRKNDRALFNNIEWTCQHDNIDIDPGSDCHKAEKDRAWIRA